MLHLRLLDEQDLLIKGRQELVLVALEYVPVIRFVTIIFKTIRSISCHKQWEIPLLKVQARLHQEEEEVGRRTAGEGKDHITDDRCTRLIRLVRLVRRVPLLFVLPCCCVALKFTLIRCREILCVSCR